MDAGESGTRSTGRNGVEQFELSVRSIDGEGADRALLVLAHALGFIGGIEARSGLIQYDATWACAHLMNAGGRHRPCGTIHDEDVNAATIAGG